MDDEMDNIDEAGSEGLGSNVKKLEERHHPSELKSMYWSPKADLVAAVTQNAPNEVVLCRMQALKKVWSHNPPCDDSEVVGITWDPSGKCLAIAYSTCQIMVLAVEKAVVLHTHHISSKPTQLYWFAVHKDSDDAHGIFFDWSCDILPPLPSINAQNADHQGVEDIMSNELNFLVVSGEHGLVNIYVHGLLSVAYMNLVDLTSHECKIVSSSLSSSASTLVSLVEGKEGQLSIAVIMYKPPLSNVQQTDRSVTCPCGFREKLSASTLSQRSPEIQVIADKFVHLVNLIAYCDKTLKKMEEAWEDGLLELDSKLNAFSTQKQLIGEGTVVNDFAELLLFGTPSDELHTFLVKDLTERGMKKLGLSMQNYYRSINDLLSSHMVLAVEAMFYHLNDLNGLAQWTDMFGTVGLSTALIEQAIQACGTLRLKINEMLHLVTSGTRNLRSFSGWLYIISYEIVAILTLSGQKVPPDLLQPPIEYDSVMAFIEDNFEGLEDTGMRIKVEKIGQYLKDCDLHCPIKSPQSKIDMHINSSPALKDSTLLYKPEWNKSLTQLYKSLVTKINAALTYPATCIASMLRLTYERQLPTQLSVASVKQFSVKRSDDVEQFYTIILSGDKDAERSLLATRITLTEMADFPLRYCNLGFGQLGTDLSLYSCSHHEVVDFDYYDKEEIMVLLHQSGENSSSRYLTIKLDLSALDDSFWSENCSSTTCDVGRFVQLATVKVLDNVSKANRIDVSGKRRIGSVMLPRRRVQLFMYDQEGEDSEEEDVELENDQDETDRQTGGGSDKENIC